MGIPRSTNKYAHRLRHQVIRPADRYRKTCLHALARAPLVHVHQSPRSVPYMQIKGRKLHIGANRYKDHGLNSSAVNPNVDAFPPRSGKCYRATNWNFGMHRIHLRSVAKLACDIAWDRDRSSTPWQGYRVLPEARCTRAHVHGHNTELTGI